MKFKIYALFLIMLFTVLFGQKIAAASDSIMAPGGNVTTMDALYEALGGENAVEKKENYLLLRRDIRLQAPVHITEGQYVLVGAGVEITAEFTDSHLFEIGDPDGEKEVRLLLGTPDSEKENENIVFNGEAVTRDGAFISIGENATFAFFSGTVFKNAVTSLSGSVIDNKGSFMMYGGNIKNCRALASGGAIYSQGTLYLASGSIENCSSECGGAVYSEGTASLIGTEIVSCIAGKGGCVFNAGTLELLSSSLSGGTAAMGGGIFNSGTAKLSGGQIITCGNENDALGGAVYNSGTLKFAGTYCSENKATSGGTVYNASVLVYESGQIYNGSAVYGGHIYNDPFAEMTFSGGTVGSGRATYGGGLYNLGTLRIDGGAFSGNKATCGSAILNEGKMTMTEKASININNDVFVVVNEKNLHAISFEGASPATTILTLTPGIATQEGYITHYDENAVLVTGSAVAEVYERITVADDRDGNTWSLTATGTLLRHLPVYYSPFFYILLLIAFVLTVAVLVFVIRWSDKKQKNL